MSQVIGTINSLKGLFFIKDEEGNVTTAKNGDTINSGDVVFGSDSNTNDDTITVALSDNSKEMSINHNNQLLFDETMLTYEISSDTVVQDEELNEVLLFEESTALVSEEVTETTEPIASEESVLEEIENLEAPAAADTEDTEDSEVLTARFEARTGNETDISTQLGDSTASAAETTISEESVLVTPEFILTLDDILINEGSGTATITASLTFAPISEPVVVTLDNGATITFGIGETTATSTEFPIQGDDVYNDLESYPVAVESFTSGTELEDLEVTGAVSTVTINDTVDDTTVTFSDVTVDEGVGTATIDATLTSPPTDAPLVITLDNGSTVTFEVGETTATSTEFPIQDADVYEDSETYSVAVESYTGGTEFENLVTSDTSTVTVQDVVNATIVTLDDVTADEGTGTATINASITSAPTDGPLILSLDNGSSITFAVGETTATSTAFSIQGDDVFTDAQSYSVAVQSHTGGTEFENLLVNDTATVTINDTQNDTTVTFGDITVNEGSGTATIDATITTAPTDAPLVITLDNNATVTFAVGETTATSTTFSIQADDVFVNGGNYAVAVQSYTGGSEFENLVTSDSATVTVNDVQSDTTVTLDDVTVDEGSGTATIGASITTAPTDAPLVLTLDNNTTVTFAIGETTATSTAFSIQSDDVHLDGESYTVSVESYTGGSEFENLVTSDSATVTVEDTTDTTTLVLNDISVEEGTELASITGSLNRTPDTELVVTLSIAGATMTFGTDYIPGDIVSSTQFSIQDDDAYNDEEEITVSVIGTSGGNFEFLDTSDTSLLTIQDTTNITNLTLKNLTVSEETDGVATIEGSLDQTPETEFVVTLSNGATLTFGTTYIPGSFILSTEFEINNDEDVYADESTTELLVESISGGNFESVNISDTSTIIISDTTDDTTVTITTSDVTEDEASVTFNVQLSNAPDPTYVGDTIVKVTVGATVYDVTVDASGAGSLVIATQDSDVYSDADSISAQVTGVTGGNYENVITGQSATANISDTTDDTTVTITTSDVTEDEASVTFNVQLSNAPDPTYVGDTIVKVTVGATVYDVTVDASGAGSLVIATQDSDVYSDADSISAQVTGVTGGNYENVITGQSATANISDTIDTVYARIVTDDSVIEGGTLTHTVELYTIVDSNEVSVTVPTGESVTVTIAYNQGGSDSADSSDYTQNLSVVIPSGASSATLSVVTNDDAFTESSEYYTAQITAVTPSSNVFEDLQFTNDSVTGTITDNDTAPQTADASILTTEDNSYVFSTSDFPYSDADGDTIDSVRIHTLPVNGKLYFDGVEVTQSDLNGSGGFTVSVAQLNAGSLVFSLNEDEHEAGDPNSSLYTTFDFSVSDGVLSSNIETITVNVTPVADSITASVEIGPYLVNTGNLVLADDDDPDNPYNFVSNGLVLTSISSHLDSDGNSVQDQLNFKPGNGIGVISSGTGQDPKQIDHNELLQVDFPMPVFGISLSVKNTQGDAMTIALSDTVGGPVFAIIEYIESTDKNTPDSIIVTYPTGANTVVSLSVDKSSESSNGEFTVNITSTNISFESFTISDTNADGSGFSLLNIFDPYIQDPGLFNYPLTLTTALTDIDGSEEISSVTLSGFPSGAEIIIDGGSAITDSGNGWVIDTSVHDINSTDIILTTSTELASGFEPIIDAVTTETGANVFDAHTIIGNAEDNTLTGADGNDYIDGGAGSDSVTGGLGDDTLVFDDNDTLIDGGSDSTTDEDTLILNASDDIDFSALDNSVLKNIDHIDLNKNGDHSLDNLTLQDVIDMTDSTDGTLKISGDGSDSVVLKNGSGDWSTSSTETIDSVTYDVYTNSEDTSYKVLIQQSVVDSTL